MDLLTDLFKAYYDARRNKRNTPSQLRFESRLEENLIELYGELCDHRYAPRPCSCFVIEDPVKREVFASDFRDRVVHHLYYNYVAPIFERTFIYDSYSCREGKGTLFGINRLEHHLRAVTNNYTQEAYILKLDIQGYFMSIRRDLLLEKVLGTLGSYWNRKISKYPYYRRVRSRTVVKFKHFNTYLWKNRIAEQLCESFPIHCDECN